MANKANALMDWRSLPVERGRSLTPTQLKRSHISMGVGSPESPQIPGGETEPVRPTSSVLRRSLKILNSFGSKRRACGLMDGSGAGVRHGEGRTCN
ncbi:hypothetical protein GN956_G24063 [Arapaima gigas]